MERCRLVDCDPEGDGLLISPSSLYHTKLSCERWGSPTVGELVLEDLGEPQASKDSVRVDVSDVIHDHLGRIFLSYDTSPVSAKGWTALLFSTRTHL